MMFNILLKAVFAIITTPSRDRGDISGNVSQCT